MQDGLAFETPLRFLDLRRALRAIVRLVSYHSKALRTKRSRTLEEALTGDAVVRIVRRSQPVLAGAIWYG
jgi:hypothetical protein